MKPIAITYATREGQTRRIAEYLAGRLQTNSLEVDVYDAKAVTRVDFGRYAAAVLAASVHIGRHEKEMVRFVQRHLAQLERIPTTFLSVSLAASGVVDSRRTPEQRTRAGADVKRAIDRFIEQTGWQPGRIHPIAGALLYREYSWLIKWIMRRISSSTGGDTDTRHDFEYTDWGSIDRLAGEIAGDAHG